MRIAVLANLKKNAPHWEGMAEDQWDDLDSPRTTDAIVEALRSAGHEAEFIEASILPPYNLIDRLQEFKPDLCFNLSESHFGDGREAQVPALLEMLRIPYTGSKVLTLALALDKPMTKRILLYHGLSTPEFQVFESANDPVDSSLLNASGELRFPLFVKPSREGTSMGISVESIVRTVAELRTQVARQLKMYEQPILCEHYIQGRELTVGMIGNLDPVRDRTAGESTPLEDLPTGLTFLPLMEVDLTYYANSEADLYTNRIKTEWADDFKYSCPAVIEPELEHRLKVLAANVFRVTGSRDISRVDFRLDANDGSQPYILEINPLPGLNPDLSDLWYQARALGWTHAQLINAIVDAAAARQGLTVQAQTP
jgi:D-alanine-D-alanine ligase